MNKALVYAIVGVCVLALVAMFVGSLMALMKSQDEELLAEELKRINGNVNEFVANTRKDVPDKPIVMVTGKEVRHGK